MNHVKRLDRHSLSGWLPENCKHWWCRIRYALGLGIHWQLNENLKAQCARCGHVFEPVTFDLPEDE